jgi:hypothetical protein
VGLTREVDPHRGDTSGSGRWLSIDGGGSRWSKVVQEVSCGTVEGGGSVRGVQNRGEVGRG